MDLNSKMIKIAEQYFVCVWCKITQNYLVSVVNEELGGRGMVLIFQKANKALLVYFFLYALTNSNQYKFCHTRISFFFTTTNRKRNVITNICGSVQISQPFFLMTIFFFLECPIIDNIMKKKQ